jgi:hypothetical protein
MNGALTDIKEIFYAVLVFQWRFPSAKVVICQKLEAVIVKLGESHPSYVSFIACARQNNKFAMTVNTHSLTNRLVFLYSITYL